MPFIEFIHTDDREMVSANYAKRLKGEEVPKTYSFQVVSKNGVVKWVEISAVLFTWEGRPATLNFLSDITERKRIEKDLQQSEERYRQLVETMNEGMGVMDENTHITFINESFCKILDYSKDEMIGRSVFDFVDHADRAVLEAQIKRRQKGESGGYEIPWVRRNGQKIYTVVSPRSIFNESGQFKGSFAVLTDITERKKRKKN